MKPKRIYYEPPALEYRLGKQLKERFSDVPWIEIQSHNNIKELRERGNEDFVEMKKYIILGIRKTHKYVENNKTSDYLAPYTSSGCSAMCLYCYLVCNYNKCSYLRLYANADQMLSKLVQKSLKTDKPCTFEIGSNSDLILENQFTGNLHRTIETFGKEGRGLITFPTKFSMVDSLLDLKHGQKTIFRMSVNPQDIIDKVEIGTASLQGRVKAVNKMAESGYQTGIMIAPIVLLDDWEASYIELLDYLHDNLSEKVKKQVFIEVILMTYSYIHRAINEQAFPEAPLLYNKEMMTGRGRGRYCYNSSYRAQVEGFMRNEIGKRFNAEKIMYIV